MNVKDVAEKIGISAHTIRYYDKSGLFPFIMRDHNGNRNFTEEDLYWIEFIKCMRQTHMPIAQIKEIAELYHQGATTKNKRMKILKSHQQNLIHQSALIEEALDTLEHKFTLIEQE
ncbi:MerR family transcriptional regulator [Staphylococcus gallinarum]|uniref:MerR family transcriptional regulator n=1 Tax=Staphylococcus gallinarum TaxID=1293 RepID=A0A3A0VNP5_STAGA|nr:MerR family transcriptional regulator [Staphylococcus gallinarum]RIP37083.1 MerR family transcriptional regulator [Staphylococcus gallinarum]